MPYIGIEATENQYELIIKFHGPLKEWPLWLREVKFSAVELLRLFSPGIDIRGTMDEFVVGLKDKYCDGNNILWVAAEIKTLDRMIYGCTAENILVS